MFKIKDAGLDLEIKDLDMKKRQVTGYFAAFGNKDSDGDIIMPGAFRKSIMENGPNSKNPRIAHLLQHDVWTPIGKIMELEEDSKGLRFTSKISESSKGNDTLVLYQEGILREHSIGFQTIKEERKDNHNELTEIKLFEGSTVTFGANAQTPVIGIKSENREQDIEKINERINRVSSVLRKGSGLTDDAFHNLAIELEQIKTLYNSLIKLEPQGSTLDSIEPGFVIEGFTNTFKLN